MNSDSSLSEKLHCKQVILYEPFSSRMKSHFRLVLSDVKYRISSNRLRPRIQRAGELVSSDIERALEYTAQDVITYTCTQS